MCTHPDTETRHASPYVYQHADIKAHEFLHIRTQPHIHKNAHIYLQKHIDTYIFKCSNTYIRTLAHTYTRKATSSTPLLGMPFFGSRQLKAQKKHETARKRSAGVVDDQKSHVQKNTQFLPPSKRTGGLTRTKKGFLYGNPFYSFGSRQLIVTIECGH